MQVYHSGFDGADGNFPTGLESAESLRGGMRLAADQKAVRIQNQRVVT